MNIGDTSGQDRSSIDKPRGPGRFGNVLDIGHLQALDVGHDTGVDGQLLLLNPLEML